MKNERNEEGQDGEYLEMKAAIDGLMQDPPQAEAFLKLADKRTKEAMDAIMRKVERKSSKVSS